MANLNHSHATSHLALLSSPVIETLEKSMEQYCMGNITTRLRSWSKRSDIVQNFPESKKMQFSQEYEIGDDLQQLEGEGQDDGSFDSDNDSSGNESEVDSNQGDECLPHDEVSEKLHQSVNNDNVVSDDEQDLDQGQKMILKYLQEMNTDLGARLTNVEGKLNEAIRSAEKIPLLEKEIQTAQLKNAALESELNTLKTKYDALFER